VGTEAASMAAELAWMMSMANALSNIDIDIQRQLIRLAFWIDCATAWLQQVHDTLGHCQQFLLLESAGNQLQTYRLAVNKLRVI